MAEIFHAVFFLCRSCTTRCISLLFALVFLFAYRILAYIYLYNNNYTHSARANEHSPNDQ